MRPSLGRGDTGATTNGGTNQKSYHVALLGDCLGRRGLRLEDGAMLSWLDIEDLPDFPKDPFDPFDQVFDIIEHREQLFRAALGDELWEWLGEMEGEDGR